MVNGASPGRLAIAVIGTDTGVGKTRVATLLVKGLRARGLCTWIHKPVACGGWEGDWPNGSAEDGRALAALCADGQASLTICPQQFPEPCSPHLAAAAVGEPLVLQRFGERVAALAATLDERAAGSAQRAALVVETVGGLLTPITTARETNADLIAACALPALVVCRPHLGTLNHTALTVNEAGRRGIRLLGLVINAAQPVEETIATRTAAGELAAITGLPVIAAFGHGAPSPADAAALARVAMARHDQP